MSLKEGESLPGRLENVRQRFEQWRLTRSEGTRIPEPLWAAAVELVDEYGLHRTAKTLRVDYYSLKKRVEASAPSSGDASCDGSSATFVELPSAARARSRRTCSECVVEFEDGYGATMRVFLSGVEVPDLVALSRSFWGIPS